MAENHEKEFKDRTWLECAWLFVREKMFSVPALVLLTCYLMLILGYFLPMVTDAKFAVLAGEFKYYFGVYCLGGTAIAISKITKLLRG